jgi:predicted NAD/FAD-binding protein
LHLIAAVLDWDPLPWGERLSVLRLAAPLIAARQELRRRGQVSIQPPNATVSEWLRRYHQGRKLREWLWEPLAVAALNQAPGEAAAAPFVRVLAEMFGTDTAAASIVLPTRPLNLMYAEPARDYIRNLRGDVRTNARAHVVADQLGVRKVEVRGETVTASRVIVAVPWFGFRGVFGDMVPPAMQASAAAAEAMTSKPIVTVNLWYDRAVMDEPFVGLPGRTMQWVFDKRFAFGSTASHLSLASSNASAVVQELESAVIALARREVEDALPAARSAQLTRATVIREKRATFSLAPDQPPRPATITPVRGLYLAGDWIDTGLPGTIESAVRSGHMAARAVQDAG